MWCVVCNAMQCTAVCCVVLLCGVVWCCQSGCDTSLRDANRQTAEELLCLAPHLPALPLPSHSRLPPYINPNPSSASASSASAKAASHWAQLHHNNEDNSSDESHASDEEAADSKHTHHHHHTASAASAASEQPQQQPAVERVLWSFGLSTHHQLGYGVGANTHCQVLPKRVDSLAPYPCSASASASAEPQPAVGAGVVEAAVTRFASYAVRSDGTVFR